MQKKASYDGSTRSTSVVSNKGGVVVGSQAPADSALVTKQGVECLKSREDVANARAARFEQKKKENQSRGLSKESAIGKLCME
jgi:hypothetical protein